MSQSCSGGTRGVLPNIVMADQCKLNGAAVFIASLYVTCISFIVHAGGHMSMS